MPQQNISSEAQPRGQPVYVDSDDPTDTTTDTTDDTYGDDGSTDSSHHDEMEVEVDGETYTAEENYDMDGDGANDTAVVETEGGYLGFEDSDGDGTADIAVEYDEDGNPVAAPEYDESSGEWEQTDVENLPEPVGGDGTADGATGSSEDITVDVEGVEDVDAGPATYDTDGDGTNDTAVVTDTDGTTYAFTDTDGDGQADEAVVLEAEGDVTVAAHTGDDEWTTEETGHIDEQGN